MKLLGIDCGVKNLAYCIYDTETKTIEKWDVIDVSEKLTYIPDMCITYLEKHTDLLDCDKVLIEKQPPRNGKMRVMEASLYCYFTLRGKIDESKQITSVETYSAKHKLGGMLGLSGIKSYGARKKAAIKKVTDLLSDNETWLRYFCEHKKRDDLADSWLMILAYITQQDDKATHEATKRILAKKPQESVKIEDYTPGNLKYVLREHMILHSTTPALTAFLNDPERAVLLHHINEKYSSIDECLEKFKLI